MSTLKKALIKTFFHLNHSFCKDFFLICQLLYNITKTMIFYYFNALKVVGVGYQFILSKLHSYAFVSVGLTHLLVFRYNYETTPFFLNKKRTLLILKSFSSTLQNECTFVSRLAPINIFSGKGIKIVNKRSRRKVGKKTTR
jgi:hypothetical protein